MTTLIIATALSDLFIEQILETNEKKSRDIIVVTDNPAIKNSLDNIGISSHLFQIDKPLNWKDRDSMFSQVAMPGYFGEHNLVNDLPLWKVLSIDRLRFWFNENRILDLIPIINCIEYDELLIGIDMYNPLPLSIAYIAKEWGKKVTAVKIESLRTREIYDTANVLPIDNWIVSYDTDKTFLNSIGVNNVYAKYPTLPKQQANKDIRESLRNAIRFNGVIAGIVFDKRDDWQFRKMFSITDPKNIPPVIKVFPRDNRSAELFCDVIPIEMRQFYNLHLTDDMKLWHMCDEMVMFRYDEQYVNQVPEIPLIICDYANVNLSKELAINASVVN